jgi:hypothetical protein
MLFQKVDMNFNAVDDNSKIKALFDSYPRQLAKFCATCFNIRKDIEYGTK